MMHIASLTLGVTIFLAVALAAVAFMIWVLYHFCLEGRRLSRNRNHTCSVVFPVRRRDSKRWLKIIIGGVVLPTLAASGFAQTTTSALPTAPAPPSNPPIAGPLHNIPPAIFDAGPFGDIDANGIFTGMGMWQSNHMRGDNSTAAALSNGQVFIQKPTGWLQFYLQGGAYDIPALGTPFLATDKTLTNLYGPVPIAYLKLQVGKNTSLEIGSLPTLVGAEYTFTFENMNVSRGLLWNQENAVTRGVQVNQTFGKFTAAISWNDYFYSNRYTAVSGSLTYTNGAHSLSFIGAGNAGQTAYQTAATPVQNNGRIFNVIYVYNKGSWTIQPYYQHSTVPTNPRVGIARGNSTDGGAILVNHTFKGGFSLPVRWEYITSKGSAALGSVNLMYGPGSWGASATVTPTFQWGGFFFRGDLSWVHVGNITAGAAFGSTGDNPNQARAAAEIGFIFGNNIGGKKP